MVIVLVFLQVFSCLGVYELTAASSAVKLSYQHGLREAYLIEMKRVLSDIEEAILNDHVTCLVPVMAATDVRKKTLDWWRQQACIGYLQPFHYYYVTEYLGEDACTLIVHQSSDNPVVTTYYRVTLFAVVDKIKKTQFILQTTLAKPGFNHLSCDDKIHRVMPGRQMMRTL